MKSTTSFLAVFAIAAGTLLGAASGCELIAGVDRTKISTGGSSGSGGAGATGGGGSAGTAGTTAGSAGTSGGSGGTGGAGCVDPTKDCTDANSGPCKVWACDASKMCVEMDAADGMDASAQTAGDCKKNVCQGGMPMSQNDDTDKFDDSNPCTVDTCASGSPKTDPATIGTACSMGGTVCDGNGACVECNDDPDCKDATKPVCISNQCSPATCMDNKPNGNETDTDCGGSCPPCAMGKTCAVGADCDSGVCADKGMGMKCQAPSCTDTVKNGTESDVDCGGSCPNKCGPSKGCNGDGDCVGAQCTGAMNGTCVPNCTDLAKNNAETDVDCGGGTCGGCGVGLDCANSDANCIGTAFCNMMSKCAAKKANGQNCMGTNQCTSGNCVDTVCCNNSCAGTCLSCNIAGQAGNCTLVPANTDPDNECNGNGGADVCDGNGACGAALGGTCAMDSDCLSGHCADGVCCNTACSGTCQACTAAKTGGTNGTCGNVTVGTDPDNDCAGALNCAAGGMCEAGTKMQGAACAAGGECASTFCTDGVCCNVACNGACRGCNVMGSPGMCSLYAAGTDPENECSMAPNLNCTGLGTCGP